MISQAILPTLDSLTNLENHLAHLEHTYLKTSYQLGNLIDAQTNPLYARITATSIPIMCFLGEIVAISIDAKRMLAVGYRSISAASLRTGNVRIGFTHLCEHLRNIAGIISGLFVSLYSPHTARKLFLIVKADNLQKKLNPEAAAKLYSLAYAVSEFFKKHHLEYRICSGSLLGAVRHGGIVPWDDDADLMIHPSCAKKCNHLFASGAFHRETGIETKWQPLNKGWQCFHFDSPKGHGPLKDTGIPFIDIFHTKFTGKEQKIVHNSRRLRNLFTEEYFTKKEWEEPKEYQFGPLKLCSIKNADEYISRHYGKNAFDFAYQVFHHDVLASMSIQPLNLVGHIRKIWKYDLPRRTYLEDRSPIKYDTETYKNDVLKIDWSLQKHRTVSLDPTPT